MHLDTQHHGLSGHVESVFGARSTEQHGLYRALPRLFERFDAGLDRRVAHAGRDFGRNADHHGTLRPVVADQQRHGFALVQPEQLSDDHTDEQWLHGDIRILVQFLGHFLSVRT